MVNQISKMAEKEAETEKAKSEAPAQPVISDQEKDWAQAALTEFNRNNYSSCLQHLVKLEAARPQDTKVAHNKAIVEYYKSDLKKTDQFRKNMNFVCGQAHVNIEDVDSLEDVEHCVIYYNQAVLLYHLKQYSTALKIMHKIFSFIEPMEESLAHCVCLLLLELQLCMHQPDKTLALVTYVENQFVVSTDSVISSEKEIKSLEKEHKEMKPVTGDAATDTFRLKLLQYRARCYLMMHALKACKREIKNLITAGGPTLTSVLLKGNLEYQRGNYRKAMKVINSIPQSSLSFKDLGESAPVFYYSDMGCIHHYMGKPQLACYYLQKALQENEMATKSLPKAEQAEPYSGRPLYTLGSNKSYELMYNLGVTLLHARCPIKAFDCLTEAVQVYHMNPRLWLRLAECCVMAHKAENESDFNIHMRRKDLVQGVVGTGTHRKIILTPQLSKDTKYSCEGQSFAIPVATVEFACLCLRNALLLLPDSQPEDPVSLPAPHSTDVPAITPSPSSHYVYAAPSNPLGPHEVASLRCSVLALSAYVALCLGDYMVALDHAQMLLVQPTLSGVHRMLGHLYAAEALVLLDKISEAIEHLNPEHVKELSLMFPSSEKDMDRDKMDIGTEQHKPLRAWFPNTLPTARAVIQYNLAVAFAIRGELDKAGETLKQVWMSKGQGCDVPIHVIMLALYIELQLGHADISRTIVKQHSPQYR
ncbi:CCR4-NOT transcription complex subunit 10 isoform X3 [Zootermopsis nevadensis]|uniref:CCR4-NOT transcription complex subunit 10 isoform X3 n=1 Tax=Zootermopsis nevadensis TaxID=136037 RepID=UPI000B8E87BA|nr:CCR4-NOT transcription complex subunit 10 isoform X3 [Zootermopsis nevadensis]